MIGSANLQAEAILRNRSAHTGGPYIERVVFGQRVLSLSAEALSEGGLCPPDISTGRNDDTQQMVFGFRSLANP